jgi:hypothetical protein
MVSRDALGDLDSTSRGNWIGNVDEGEALRRLGALSPAEKQRFATEERWHATIERLCSAFDGGEMLRMFQAIPQFDLRWRVYWLGRAGVRDGLSQAQWQQVVGFAGPTEMDALRRYPDGWNAFVHNAAIRVVPPWDLLEALEAGRRNLSPVDTRNAVEALSPTQKTQVLADDGKMRAIMRSAGDSNEKFRVVTYLNPACKWKCHWLNVGNALTTLTSPQWSQILAEAPKNEYDELVGWTALWQVVERSCPANIIQITRQNADTATAVAAFSDPVQINALFSSLGPAGFLAEATKGEEADVTRNYGSVKTAGKVRPTVDGLPKGAQMGAQAKANLRSRRRRSASTCGSARSRGEGGGRVIRRASRLATALAPARSCERSPRSPPPTRPLRATTSSKRTCAVSAERSWVNTRVASSGWRPGVTSSFPRTSSIACASSSGVCGIAARSSSSGAWVGRCRRRGASPRCSRANPGPARPSSPASSRASSVSTSTRWISRR